MLGVWDQEVKEWNRRGRWALGARRWEKTRPLPVAHRLAPSARRGGYILPAPVPEKLSTGVENAVEKRK